MRVASSKLRAVENDERMCIAEATLERLVAILRPMEGAEVLALRTDGFTLRFECCLGPLGLERVGKLHVTVCSAATEAEAWSDEPVFEGAVAEDEDFVYSGAGVLGVYDGESCPGAFDVEVYVVPRDKRPALVLKLVQTLRDRARDAAKESSVPRRLYKRMSTWPVTNRPRVVYYNAEGIEVLRPKAHDTIVDET